MKTITLDKFNLKDFLKGNLDKELTEDKILLKVKQHSPVLIFKPKVFYNDYVIVDLKGTNK